MAIYERIQILNLRIREKQRAYVIKLLWLSLHHDLFPILIWRNNYILRSQMTRLIPKRQHPRQSACHPCRMLDFESIRKAPIEIKTINIVSNPNCIWEWRQRRLFLETMDDSWMLCNHMAIIHNAMILYREPCSHIHGPRNAIKAYLNLRMASAYCDIDI